MRRTLIQTILPLGLIATAAAQTSMLPFLPEGTVVAVSAPDLNASVGEFGQMPLAKMWHEAEVQDFLQDAIELARQQFMKGMEQARAMHKAGKIPVDPDVVSKLTLRGGTFALTQMGLTVGQMGPMPKFGMLLHIDFGTSAEQWFGLINMGLQMGTQAAGDQLVQEDSVVEGTKLMTFRPRQAPPDLEMGLCLAMVGDGIVVGTLPDEVRGVVESMKKGRQVLGGTDRYKENLRHLDQNGAEVTMFMRVDPILDFATQALKVAAEFEPQMAMIDVDGIGRAVEALGLKSITSIGGTSSYDGGKAVSRGYIVAPAPSRKGFLAGANKNLELGFLKWVPKGAVSFSAATLDPMSMHDAIVAALNAYDKDMATMLMKRLESIEKQIGFSIRDDLFGALGDTFVSWSLPMASIAAPPESAFLLRVKDEEKVVKVLKSLAALSDGAVSLEESEKRGVKSYQFRLNLDPMGGMGMNFVDVLNPSFAFKDGWMVAGFSPSDIRRVFQRMERQDDDPKADIRGNKEFMTYSGQIPEAVQSLSFTDWKANFESFYQVINTALAFVPMSEDVPLDMSRIPDASTLTKHLFGSLTYSKADGNGFETKSVGPFGPELALLFGGLAVAGVGAALAWRARF